MRKPVIGPIRAARLLIVGSILALVSTIRAETVYTVEVSENDELFVINGEVFEAQTYCFGVRVGDEVIFLKGSANGACASATFLNLRTKQRCNVWCE